MAAAKIRCTVVEVTGETEHSAPRELLPWSDPFIAKLVSKYRLRAALDDSLRFLEHDAIGHGLEFVPNVPRATKIAPFDHGKARATRFKLPGDETTDTAADHLN